MRAAATMSASQAAAEFQDCSAHSNGPGDSSRYGRTGLSSAATAGHTPVDHSAICTQAAEPEVVDLCSSDDDQEMADTPLQPAGTRLPSSLKQRGALQSSRRQQQQQQRSQRQVQRQQQQQRDGAAGGRGQGWQLGFAPSRPQANGAAPSSAADTSAAAGSGSGSNPFLSPARYIPEAGRLYVVPVSAAYWIANNILNRLHALACPPQSCVTACRRGCAGFGSACDGGG